MIGLLPLPDGLGFATATTLVATVGGAGLVDPLRAGLAVGVVALVACVLYRPGRPGWAGLLTITTGAGLAASHRWGVLTGVVDDRQIVIDEVAGFAAAMLVIGRKGWRVIAATAAAFLFLDRLKPWPFSLAEGVPGATGVMLDDLVVGLSLGALMLVGSLLLSSHGPDLSGTSSADRRTQDEGR
jgi:phosphatidylglycerophosphatase A